MQWAGQHGAETRSVHTHTYSGATAVPDELLHVVVDGTALLNSSCGKKRYLHLGKTYSERFMYVNPACSKLITNVTNMSPGQEKERNTFIPSILLVFFIA
jgi:hypothetical protein